MTETLHPLSKAETALELYQKGGKESAAKINQYMKTECAALENLWQQLFPSEGLGSLGRHIYFGMDQDYIDIQRNDIPELQKRARKHLKDSLRASPTAAPSGFAMGGLVRKLSQKQLQESKPV
jgi:hypothetical protein